MIKEEAIQLPMKKIECNLHGNQIKLKCEFPGCKSPYLCSHYECLEEHFHDEGPLVARKFNSTLWESKFQEAENIIKDNTLKNKEHFLTKVVKYFTGNLSKIQEEVRLFEKMKFKFHQFEGQTLNPQFLNQVDGLLTMGSKLERKIDKLRSKINQQDLSLEESSEIVCYDQQEEINEGSNPKDKNLGSQIIDIHLENEIQKPVSASSNKKIDPLEQHQESQMSSLAKQNLLTKQKRSLSYTQNTDLTNFLGKHIKGFTWTKANELFTISTPSTTCQKFHEKLRDRSNLLFLFVGDSLIIGSYYEVPYPSVIQRSKKDQNSFIFIEDQSLQEKFALFRADPEGDSHISVSEKLLICQGNTPNNGDGLRTFQRNFDSLAYFLPSRSFRDSIEGREVNYNGVLKIKQFFILQLTID